MKFRKSMILICALALFGLGVGLLDNLTNTQTEDVLNVLAPVSSKVGTTQKNYLLETFIAPVSDDVSIVRYFYEVQSTNNQEALDYFEGIYRKSEGVDYGLEEEFEVMASLSGTVSEVKNDSILGSCVTIDCENGFQLIYQSLSNVGVEKGQSIAQGDLIGHSGYNIYEAELGNHVHFTVLKDGNALNPLSIINKQLKEIE